jgi:hypothetical protein
LLRIEKVDHGFMPVAKFYKKDFAADDKTTL